MAVRCCKGRGRKGREYGAAPNVVYTFCKEYDWSGKKVAAFATSGGSGIGKTAEKLKPYVQGSAHFHHF